MKKLGLILAMIMFCSVAKAQCVAEIKDSEIDINLGSVKVMTQYILNGQAVDVVGEPCDNCIYTSGRYDESQGTLEEIIALNESDREAHCKNLLVGQLSKQSLSEIHIEKLKERKKQNEKVKDEFKKEIGEKIIITNVKEIYKNKEITIEADGTYTIADITP